MWAQLAMAAASATQSGGSGGGGGGMPGMSATSRSGDISVPLDFSFDRQFNPAPPGGGASSIATGLMALVGLLIVVKALKG